MGLFRKTEIEYHEFKPKKDITTFELAQCLGLHAGGFIWNDLPKTCLRHFKIIKEMK